MPKKPDGWDLVREGRYGDAIVRLREEYEKSGEELILSNLGCAYLLKGEPDRAVEVLEGILTVKYVSTGHYAMAGIANWLVGRYERAVLLWKKGQKCQYADAAGGMELPLLLYYASLRKQELVHTDEIRDLLAKQLQHPWATCWPGPIGAFVLDKITEEEVRKKALFVAEEVTQRQMMEVDFYVGVKALVGGHRKKFQACMKQCASMAGGELTNEFYLARHEVAHFKAERRYE